MKIFCLAWWEMRFSNWLEFDILFIQSKSVDCDEYTASEHHTQGHSLSLCSPSEPIVPKCLWRAWWSIWLFCSGVHIPRTTHTVKNYFFTSTKLWKTTKRPPFQPDLFWQWIDLTTLALIYFQSVLHDKTFYQPCMHVKDILEQPRIWRSLWSIEWPQLGMAASSLCLWHAQPCVPPSTALHLVSLWSWLDNNRLLNFCVKIFVQHLCGTNRCSAFLHHRETHCAVLVDNKRRLSW